MSRMNLDPLFTFQDGSHLVVSTQWSKDGDFSCTLYTANTSTDGEMAFRVISSHLQATTCLEAQGYAYEHAVHLYPRMAEVVRKPPYLIWHGPQSMK